MFRVSFATHDKNSNPESATPSSVISISFQRCLDSAISSNGTNYRARICRAISLADQRIRPIRCSFKSSGHSKGMVRQFSWRGVRTSEHMYARTEILHGSLRSEEDPFEMKNLATDTGSEATRKSLDERLQKWMRATGDSWKFNWTDPR